MGETITKRVQLVHEICCVCGIDFSMPDWFRALRRDDGQLFYCPAGHSQVYSPTDADKLRSEVGKLRAALTAEQDQRKAAQREATERGAELDRLKTRAANGVCPCCHRRFVHLARHMSTKHPDYAGDRR